jgi:N utilization substance protein B
VSARSKARKKALDILFEADVRQAPVADALVDFTKRRESAGQPPLNPFTVEIVQGVLDHWFEIDDVIMANSIDWPIDRMPRVDRNLLRIGVFELRWRDDVPDKVAVAEAVGLARELSTEESPRFVNGILAQVMANKGP